MTKFCAKCGKKITESEYKRKYCDCGNYWGKYNILHEKAKVKQY